MGALSKVVSALLALGIAACSSAPSGGIVTGSLPSLGNASLPSVGGLLPSMPASGTPIKPERVGSNLYRISTADRRIQDPIQRENYALLRAAESTREVGGTHFIVVNTGNRSGLQTSGLAGSAEPGTLIRVFDMSPGTEPPIGAIDAAEIVHFFGPNFGRERTAAAPPR